MNQPFDTPIEHRDGMAFGPLRAPKQMLAEQQYDSHTSIHDDATAQKLGFRGGTIEGPTHFSQFAPLCVSVWGVRWLEAGCLSAHYRNACFEGERVRASIALPSDGASSTRIWMHKEDGTEVLQGTASIGPDHGRTALDERLTQLPQPEKFVILRDVSLGQRTARLAVVMNLEQHMGALYPFSLASKLKVITENSSWYRSGDGTPWNKPIIPFEMISVLLNHAKDARPFGVRGPVVGLFADQEVKLVNGPLFVGETYEIDREIVALSGSRRTESMWVRTRVFRPGSDDVLATMLLNSAYLKDSFANYAEEAASN